MYFFIFITILITTVAFNIDTVKERMFSHTYKQLHSTTNDKISKNVFLFSEGHEILIFSSLKMFYQNPIFGIGPNLYRFECANKKYFISGEKYPNFSLKKESLTEWYKVHDKMGIAAAGPLPTERNAMVNHCNTHPHNYYVQILSETGIMGALFVFFALISFAIHSIKIFFIQIKENKYMDQYKIFIYSAIIVNIWPITTTGNFFGSSAGNLFWLPVGFFLASLDLSSKK